MYPVLPGSPIAIVTVLAGPGPWARRPPGRRRSSPLICVAGWSASAVLTGQLKQLEVPGWSIGGLVAGLVGMFLIPVVGIFVGFAAGLLPTEAARHRARARLCAQLETLKATARACSSSSGYCCVAASVWTIG